MTDKAEVDVYDRSIVIVVIVFFRVPFHVKHAQLSWTSANKKIIKHVHIRHPKQRMSKQSCTNRTDGLKKQQQSLH